MAARSPSHAVETPRRDHLTGEGIEMFCPRCGQQAAEEVRFCSRCGLPLGLVVDLLDNSAGHLQRQKREVTGISLMMATVLMLTNFVIVFGAVTLPHLANPVFLWVWLGFVVSSLIVGGVGLANLIRGGFFKRLKEREAQLSLLKVERERPTLPEESKGAGADTEAMPLLVEPASVTETTTRELEPIPRTNRRDLL